MKHRTRLMDECLPLVPICSELEVAALADRPNLNRALRFRAKCPGDTDQKMLQHNLAIVQHQRAAWVGSEIALQHTGAKIFQNFQRAKMFHVEHLPNFFSRLVVMLQLPSNLRIPKSKITRLCHPPILNAKLQSHAT